MASPSMKRFKFTDASTVTLEVGRQRPTKKFIIHKDPLCNVSDFFRAGFREGRFKEGAEQYMRLPQDKAEVVEDFVRWMYTGEIMEIQIEKFEKVDAVREAYDRTFALYGFAEKICCVALKKVFVDQLFNVIERRVAKLPKIDAVRRVYALTPPASALREMMVAIYCCMVALEWFLKRSAAKYVMETDAAFAEAVFKGYVARLAGTDGGNPFEKGNVEFFYEEDTKALAKAQVEQANAGEAATKN